MSNPQSTQPQHTAALIAAAPDLLNALKAMLAEYRTVQGEVHPALWTDAERIAESAVAKAEGR